MREWSIRMGECVRWKERMQEESVAPAETRVGVCLVSERECFLGERERDKECSRGGRKRNRGAGADGVRE